MLRRRGRPAPSGPLLSVVVPVYEVEAHVDACLTSIRDQSYRAIEVVVVDDGSPDGSMAIVRRHAAQDARIVVVEQENRGVSAARNAGVAAATGELLTFVDPDDLVTADGLATAVASVGRTGSDVALLQYGRLRDGKKAKAAPWIRSLHATDRLATTLDESPDVLVNATPWGKVFRREFYDSAGLHFVEGVIYEDQAFTAAAYAAARGIDVLATTGYWWRVNETSLSQGQVTVENLTARIDAASASLAELVDHPRARGERALQQLRHNMTNSLLKLERADDAYLAVLVDRLPELLDAAPPEEYAATVPAEMRVLHALVRGGDHDAVWRFVQAEGMQPRMHPAGPEPAGWTVYLPGWGVDPVDPAAYVLTAEQTALQATVRGVRQDGRDLVLDLAAWFPHVDAAQVPHVLSVTDADAVVTQDGAPVVVASRQGAERRYVGSGWTVRLPGRGRRRPTHVTVRLVAGPFDSARRLAL